VARHRQRLLFPFFDTHSTNRLTILGGATVDEYGLRLAHSDRVGDLEQRFLVPDGADLPQAVRVHRRLEQCPGRVDPAHTPDRGQNIDALLEL
jgi:hypothetical protein